MPSITRRSVLGLIGGCTAAGVAGAVVASAEPDRTPLVVVNNQTSDEQTISTVIRRAETDEKVVDETRSIPADDEEGYGDLVAGETLVVTIQAANGLAETYHWEETAPENALSVGITSDKIGFAVATPS